MVQVIKTLSRMRDVRSTRLALGLTLAQGGELLGDVHPNGHGGKAYTRQAVSTWEQRGRFKKYRMTAGTREAYARIVDRAVRDGTDGRASVRARLGPRVWKFEAVATCARCGTPFVMRRSSDHKCRRCLAR